MRKAVNYAGFQIGWSACVVGASRGLCWLGPAVAAVLVAAHLASAPRPRRELRALAAVGLLGAAIEAAALSAGLYEYACAPSSRWLPPAWIVALWVLLAATFDSSLGWLAGRPGLAALFGAVGSPLSFSAGARLGAARLLVPAPLGLAALAAIWAVGLPAALAAAGSLRDGGRR